MNAKTLARFVIVFAAAFAAVGAAQAKGSNMSVGLTIVSSCAVSSANAYRAASSSVASAATVAAGCTDDRSYKVSMSSAAKVASSTGETADNAVTTSSYTLPATNDVVVTLTY